MPEWNHAVNNFSVKKPVFSQESYEETVGAQADMLITLEALRNDVNEIAKSMADIEVYIYGNSKDIHDNFDDTGVTKDGIGANRHTMQGMMDRVRGLQDECRYN